MAQAPPRASARRWMHPFSIVLTVFRFFWTRRPLALTSVLVEDVLSFSVRGPGSGGGLGGVPPGAMPMSSMAPCHLTTSPKVFVKTSAHWASVRV